jgi:hypothetical protein
MARYRLERFFSELNVVAWASVLMLAVLVSGHTA